MTTLERQTFLVSACSIFLALVAFIAVLVVVALG